MSSQPAGFKAEYARSGRSQCHFCKEPIPSANLRIGSIHFFQGRESCHWHHAECFFKRGFTVPEVSSIQGIDKLLPNAQDFLKKSVQKLHGLQSSPSSSTTSPSTPHRAQAQQLAKRAEAEGAEEQQDLRKFTLEDPEEDRIEPMRFRSKQRATSNASSSAPSSSSAPATEESPFKKQLSRTNSLFLEAVKSGNAEEAKNFLDLGADPDAEVAEGVTALTFSVFKGFVNLTREILQYSPNVNTQTKLGETPLFLAAKAGSLDIAQLLLNHHAEKSIPNAHGVTPQQVAVERGHKDLVEILLDIPADPEQPLKRDPSNHSSLPVFSLEMAGGNPSAGQSFSSSASTQIDDPMQGSTFIEPAPQPDSPPARDPPQDGPGFRSQHPPDSSLPGDMDTFDQQQTHLLSSSSSSSAAKKSASSRQGNKRDLEQDPPSDSPAGQPVPKRPRTADSRAKVPPESPPGNTLASFLREVGLEPEKFLRIFEEEEIDFGALMTLQEHHLADLGLKMGPRNKILAGIARYKSSPAPSSLPPAKAESQGGANQSAEYEMAPIYIKVKQGKGKGKATPTPTLVEAAPTQPARARNEGFTALTPAVTTTTPRRSTRRQRKDHSSGGGETSETEVSEQEPAEMDGATIIIPKPPPASATTFIIKPRQAEEKRDDERELRPEGDDPAELDGGYQSTLEVSPEKKPPASRAVDTASTVQDQTITTPATTLASTLIQPNPSSVPGSVSQLLSEIGHQSFSASRQLNNGSASGNGGNGNPNPEKPPSPKKSPTKSFKAPEFNFKNAPPPAAGAGEPETQRDPPDDSQTQPYRSPPEKKVTYTVTKPKTSPPGRPAQSQVSANPNPTSHLSFIMSAIRTPIKDYLLSFSPRPNQTVGSKEVIKIELKPSVNLLRPHGFVSVQNDLHEAVKGNIDVTTKGSSLVTFSPLFPWKGGMTYTITLHADHTEVVGAGLLKDYSWTFFVM